MEKPYFPKPSECIFCEFCFIFFYHFIPSDRVDILETCEKRYCPDDVGCPRLMTKWKSCSLVSESTYRIYRSPSTECWTHFSQELLTTVEKSDPRITHHLVARRDKKIYPVFHDISHHMRESLRTIDDKERLFSQGVKHLFHSPEIEHFSCHIRSTSDTEDFRIRKLGVKRIVVYGPIGAYIDPIDNDTILFSKDLPRNDIRMMINFREENSLSFLEEFRFYERTSEKIEGIGRIVSKDEFIRTTRKFFCDRLLCSIIEER